MTLKAQAPDEYVDRWSVVADLRRPGTGWDDEANYAVRDELQPQFPTVDFDPESSCFYAYADTEAELVALIAAIEIFLPTLPMPEQEDNW